jgi:large subunit ribosomal protein L10
LAISKQRKNEIVDQYIGWLKKSRAVILTEYTGLTMKDLDQLREKLRENGSEFHIIKNTLGKILVRNAGLTVDEKMFTGSTAMGFAFEDAPSLAKAISEFASSSDFVKIKGGYLSDSLMTADQVKALADMPPLPILRAQLLGMLNAPASKLARVLAEPGRQIAAVIKAYAENENIPAEA